MSGSIPLWYALPDTQLRLTATVRMVVTVDDAGGHLEPEVVVGLVAQVVPDRSARCSATLDFGGHDAGLAVTVSEYGLIDSVASGLGPALLPAAPAGSAGAASAGTDAVRAVRSVLGLGGGAGKGADRSSWTAPGALRKAFGRTHPRTAALIADLSARAEQFLAGLRMSDLPEEVQAFGAALEVVERELAAADRMRREWIAVQGHDVRSGVWILQAAELAALDGLLGTGAEAPVQLPADLALPEGTLTELARDYGVLPVVLDPDRDGPGDPGPEGFDRTDEILVRRPRPVTVLVYRRAPEGPKPAAPAPWVRDDALTLHVDVVDAHSRIDVLGPQPHGAGEWVQHLALRADGSVRALGVTAGAGAVAAGAVGTTGAGLPGWGGPGPSLSEVTAMSLETARLQLALLQVSDEFTKLAAVHAHGGELTTLEQDARFATLRGLSG